MNLIEIIYYIKIKAQYNNKKMSINLFISIDIEL